MEMGETRSGGQGAALLLAETKTETCGILWRHGRERKEGNEDKMNDPEKKKDTLNPFFLYTLTINSFHKRICTEKGRSNRKCCPHTWNLLHRMNRHRKKETTSKQNCCLKNVNKSNSAEEKTFPNNNKNQETEENCSKLFK